MRHITLAGLNTGLADLLNKRLPALRMSNAGKTYEKILLDKKAKIDALPEALRGKPLADVLTQVDDDHDGFGSAIWFQTESYLRWPELPAHMRAAILRIRAAFVPELNILQGAYATQIDAAAQNKTQLVELQDDLRAIPLAGGYTLYDWCSSFIAKGEQLGTFLSDRTDLSLPGRAEANKLRSSTIGVLGRLRAAMADEMAVEKGLPADLDVQVFGFLDDLEKMAASAAAARKKPAPPAPV